MNRIVGWFCRHLPAAAVAALAVSSVSAAPTTQPATTQPTDPAVAASLITLHMKNASAETVYRALFKQAGAPLRISPDNLFASQFGVIPPLSIDVDHRPFWEVIRQLNDKSRLSLLDLSSDIRLAHSEPIFPGPASASGAFLFVATDFAAVINLTAHGSAPNTSPPASTKSDSNVEGELLIVVYYEPRLKILHLSRTVKVQEAVDDNGNSLVPDSSHAGAEGRSGTSSGWPQIVAALRFPDKNPGKRIKYMRGTVTVTVAGDDGKPHTVDVPIELTDLDMNLKGE